MRKWKTLLHNGVAIPPPYEPKGLGLAIRGERVIMTPLQEEMAYAWALKKDTPYVKEPVFIANFLSDFLKTFDKRFRDASIDEIDFSEVFQYVDRERQLRNDPEYRKKLSAERKRRREELKSVYGYAVVDGKRFEVSNWMVEPPGIFMGRGNHPLRGRWKPRVGQEDITLNLGEDAPIPPGNWGGIIHDHNSMWLARWDDKLTGKEKYVWLSDTATIRQRRDREKYDKALKLGKHIEVVRAEIMKALKSDDPRTRKIAMACYLIDRLALRVGDEKDPDEADTVGATTLRVEHAQLNGTKLELDFLGKDSVRWQKGIDLRNEPPEVYSVLSELLSGKRPDEQIFDGISSRDVNRFLGKILKGLTAKVFRTYLATEVVKESLRQTPLERARKSEHAALYYAKLANLNAAVTCNHKRAPPKNWENSLAKKEEAVKRIESKIAELKSSKKKKMKSLARLMGRLEKSKYNLELALKTRDYNLNTSLRNYIDPRVYKAWGLLVRMDWRRIYSASLQRKFDWVKKASVKEFQTELGTPAPHLEAAAVS
ncbi:MAG: DNA topoisomerase I [Nitrososphaerota archaeon]